jgi:hypothetical protein
LSSCVTAFRKLSWRSHLADQKHSIQHDAGDQDAEEQHSHQVDGETAAVVMDPGDVEDDREQGKAHAQRDGKRFGPAAACEVHRKSVEVRG